MDVYLGAIRSLAGEGTWQIFEHFVRFLSRFEWPDSTCEKTPDSAALFDIFVYGKDGRLIAQLECKAEYKLELNNALAQQLERRLAKVKEEGCKPKTSALVTTAFIDKGRWKCFLEQHPGLKGLKCWDANVLAGKLCNNLKLSAFFPCLRWNNEFLRRCGVQNILYSPAAAEKGSHSIPSVELLNEEPGPLDAQLQPGAMLYRYGPPNVGKTCWAVQQGRKGCCSIITGLR